MSDLLRIGLVQMNSRSDKSENLAVAERLIEEAARQGAELVALPEYVNFLGPRELHEANAEPIPGPTTERFAALARRYGIYLLGGSILERSAIPGKYYNTSVLFAPDGEIIASYRKIHLFDVDLTGNVTSNESATILPGDRVVTAEVAGHVVGLTICYDLRFPELYRLLALDGAELILVPAAFTLYTGKDHWHTLLRARAIENQCYVAAPAQIGPHDPGQQCYGHSLVADPWGTVIAEAINRVGVVVTTLDFAYLRAVRAQLPSLANRRPETYGSLALTR
ncbi:MAG: carbon-nitrogen hydrolase family protein [Thermomicrobium sp.]|jgi:predicted amidohydrolase|uniref:carbon-nitrogen hydrolase family protein n=1 Tax=Thermomicrobium sp. TaxID=1969469 RepID=UPI001B1F5844|nr:carbon-nitrogen hydrolase family protein [Thermomicrobium sp.]MBO9350247.1 carbon-nitrogen hydrolase family protein [Thermomicrobium sp.]